MNKLHMFTGISRGGRALPGAVWSIIRATASATQGSAALYTSARQQSQAGAPVLVVQDRSQSQSQTEEALRLAQTYAGKHTHDGGRSASTTMRRKQIRKLTHSVMSSARVVITASPMLAGRECRAVKVGQAQGRPLRASTYFGKGAVDWLQQHIAEDRPEK